MYTYSQRLSDSDCINYRKYTNNVLGDYSSVNSQVVSEARIARSLDGGLCLSFFGEKQPNKEDIFLLSELQDDSFLLLETKLKKRKIILE